MWQASLLPPGAIEPCATLSALRPTSSNRWHGRCIRALMHQAAGANSIPPMAHHLTVSVRRVDSLSAIGQEMSVRAVPAREQPFVFFPSVGEYPVYDDRVYDGFDVPDQRLRAY